MKKYIAILVLILTCQAIYSQNIDKLFNEFAKKENVTRVSIGPIIMKLSSIFTETMGVNGIEVLDFDDCSKDVKENLRTAIRKLKDDRFETMITSNEDNNHVKVMVRIDKKMIRELVIFCTGEDNALIRIKGKIKPSDLEQVVKEHKNGH
ncbi:DUF4252 domain-containing protein [Parabacteroides sp. AM08-6]|uniref:DUF4252 domain-containing protein n=1 Tax=Parabacteroides sp. AM08-6 TaxID=2292053 RepID=UPI000EFF7A2C|nr:DUF4252 domain-containing protein [Parabacteroides sp. AM08-6]RHJ84770.1 DUF4252 domain-containing protein [Parabacteroides sp. AM08-6]